MCPVNKVKLTYFIFILFIYILGATLCVYVYVSVKKASVSYSAYVAFKVVTTMLRCYYL